MSWPYLRVDWWDNHDLSRGCLSNESSHKFVYNDDDPLQAPDGHGFLCDNIMIDP